MLGIIIKIGKLYKMSYYSTMNKKLIIFMGTTTPKNISFLPDIVD